jgi:hypothetical protein
MKRTHVQAFTFVELLVASAVFSAVTMALVFFSQASLQLASRNLATNHSHDSARITELKLLKTLHEAASPLRLFNFDGTNYTDVDPPATSDREVLAGKYVSTRANGVRFRVLAGGPYRLAADTTPSSTSLLFDFGVGGQLPYTPQVGDKIKMPVISREFAITGITTPPTGSNTQGRIVVNAVGGIGFTINATAPGNMTTAYFYRSVAYSVWNGSLRYHPNFTGTNRSTTIEVRDRITSPLPFAFLMNSASNQAENMALRVSLETYDPNYGNRRYQSGTSTLQTIIPPLTIPTPVAQTDSY